MTKRVFLFIAVNILVVVSISLTLNVLGLHSYLTEYGINYKALLIFCSFFGFLGAFISLAMSRFAAKTFMGVQVILPDEPMSHEEQFLLNTVYRFAQDCGITTMPEVGIYPSNEVNAFATGPGKNSALVAVSKGLLQRMDKKAIEGVLAHEMAHIANGDMVTMTLIQGIVNTFVMFFARIAAWVVANAIQGDKENRGVSYLMVSLLTFVFEIFLSILGSILVAFFSRIREYKADHIGAQLAGTQKMIYALECLKQTIKLIDPAQPSIASLKISGNSSKLMRLLATHPDLEDRIARLKNLE
ncbi:MAG: protease HtpX [Candidatus Brocadiae bacterium]|nr:protease HtpX [Candidatus Brocadiia bacterium]